MILRYRYAIVSFCRDLTKPDGESLPLAALLIGKVETDGAGIAAIVAKKASGLPDDLDPFSRAVVGDLVDLIKNHVDERPNITDADPADVLHAFEQSLRNTIHVSKISDECELQVETDDVKKLADCAMRECFEAFRSATKSKPATTRAQPASQRTPHYLEPGQSELQQAWWQLVLASAASSRVTPSIH